MKLIIGGLSFLLGLYNIYYGGEIQWKVKKDLKF